MGEADPDEEGHHARDGFELSDFDVVISRPGAGSDQQLLNAVVRGDAHDPDPIITRALLVCRLLAQDFCAIAAFHEFAETCFRNHIWCFDVPVHGPAHAFFNAQRPGILT